MVIRGPIRSRQGKCKNLPKENPELADEIETKIRGLYFSNQQTNVEEIGILREWRC